MLVLVFSAQEKCPEVRYTPISRGTLVAEECCSQRVNDGKGSEIGSYAESGSLALPYSDFSFPSPRLEAVECGELLQSSINVPHTAQLTEDFAFIRPFVRQ